MRPTTVAAITKRIADTSAARARTRGLVAAGRWTDAEDDPTRSAAYDARVAKAVGVPEAVHGTNDFQPAAFLPDGATARRPVARVLVQLPAESTSGTGFLISPDLFITNQHVIRDADDAAHAVVIFDDELDHAGSPTRRSTYRLLPERVALFSDENDLDYALLSLGDRIDGAAAVADLGYCPLSFTPDRHRKGMNVNIIQHPNALPKIIAVRNNLLTDRTDTRLLYETDTDEGSSGSPVFNDQWDVVALHHYGAPSAAPAVGAAAGPTASVNEGIRISAIYQDLQIRAKTADAVTQEILQRALALWTDTTPTGKQLERRPSTTGPAESVTALAAPDQSGERIMTATSQGQSIVIPLEISVRIGTLGGAAPGVRPQESATAAAAPVLKQLTKAAEGVKLDTDYSNRNGFNAKFVPGLELDLGKLTQPKKSSVAPLHDGETDPARGELRYQNFSVIMHKRRHFALLTATNIDGLTYIAIDRTTGLPAATQPEGETWYRDSRISDSYFVDQTFYSGWSHLFDRGHLTRRNDPTWGEFATRANKDTFHFTNCTPQHWKFNESIKFWQGIERYVLEQGLFVSGRDKALTVLQGPVFDDANDLWAEAVQIPARFWKIVTWKGSGGLKAVAMICDQTKLMSLQRSGGGGAPPPPDTPVDVTEFRSSIATIEAKTGLDLSALKPYDTSAKDLPVVGEAVAAITKWADIPLA